MNFFVPYASGESEFIEKKSRFITHIWPIDSEKEALSHIRDIKAQYHDARHNTYCYVVHPDIVRYSDDGEPQGTAGQPMLKVFERENVKNYCCVVTRYFGGILLGTGGLSRAYAKGAKDGLISAGIAEQVLHCECVITVSYTNVERIKKEITTLNGIILNSSYEDNVHMKILIKDELYDKLNDSISELCAGRFQMQLIQKTFVPGERLSAK